MENRKPKVESVSDTITTSDGQVLMLTVACEPVQRVAREEFPALRAHLARMAEVTNA